MFRLKHNLVFLLSGLLVASAAILAQTEAQIESDQVKRVGTHINCQCGSCNENINCMMSAGQCHFCKPARTKIYKMQMAGLTDGQIVQRFISGIRAENLPPRSELVLLGDPLRSPRDRRHPDCLRASEDDARRPSPHEARRSRWTVA